MASPRPTAADRDRERLRISAATGLPLASPRLRLHRGAEISFNSSRSPAVAPGARADDSDDSAQRVPLRPNASPRTPSGFGLSSQSHAHTGPGGFPAHLAKATQPEFVKGHRVLKISTLLSRYPCVFVATGVLIVMSIVWLALMPSHLAVQDYIAPRAAAVVQPTSESPLQPPVAAETPQLVAVKPEPPPDMPSMQHPGGGIIMPPRKPPTASELAAAAALLAQEAERLKQLQEQQQLQQQPQQPVVPTEAPKVTPDKIAKQPEHKEPEPTKQAEKPKQQEQPSIPAQKPAETKPAPVTEPVPVVPPVVTEPSKPAVSPPPSELPPKDNTALLQQSDLDESALRCRDGPTSTPAHCDWRWGPKSSHSGSSEEHPREDLAAEGAWIKPQDFYSFQAGVHVSGEGAGALVRIHLKDLCCTAAASAAAKMPLSYFRVTAHGTAQTAANPPLALGPQPAALGRGHQAVHLAKRGWGVDVDLGSASAGIDEERVLQTFLLLPDAGRYAIQVRLLHYNVSADMVAENYRMNSKLYNERPGLWVNGLLKNVRGEEQTLLTIPQQAESLRADRRSLPLCGQEGGGRLGGRSPHGTSFGMPLAGRWLFNPPKEADAAVGWDPAAPKDLTSFPRRWLVEHSQWQPYFCQLDHTVPFSRALEKVQWLHFTGDSNIRHMFFYVCEMANGTLLSVDPKRVPRFLDPPHFCVGPSSPTNAPDKDSGMAVGSAARWVLTYTNWFWGKHQTLNQPAPETRFAFREQCGKFVEQNQTGLFYGWPHCAKAPEFIQQLDGPGLTYFGWGSHAAEMGANPATDAYLKGEEAFGLTHFRHHPTIFPLTTANTPQRIPDKFGRQQCMRNNERVHASNLHVVDAIMSHRLKYATRTEGGPAAAENWVPIFDIFSPTHAAYEDLAVDAVHFDYFFSYQEPLWLMHYIAHAPNWGTKAKQH